MNNTDSLPELDKKSIKLSWLFAAITALVLILGISQASATAASINSASATQTYSSVEAKLEKAKALLSAAENERDAFIANNLEGKNTSWVDHQVEMAQIAKQSAERALEGLEPESGLSVSQLRLINAFWVIFTIVGVLVLGGFAIRYYLIGTKERRAFNEDLQLKENARLEAEEAARRRKQEAELLAAEKKNPVNTALNGLFTWGLIFLFAGIIFQIWGSVVVTNALNSSWGSLDAKAIANGTALQVSGNWFVGVGVAMLIAKQVASAINWQIRQSFTTDK